MDHASWWTTFVFFADLSIRIVLSFRVIMRRLPVPVSLAWLFVVVAFPVVGAVAYLCIGELRLGQVRAARTAELRKPFQVWLREIKNSDAIDWSLRPTCAALARTAEALSSVPALSGNRLQLLPSYDATLKKLIEDIDAAQRTCHLEFYIWEPGGTADKVVDALLRAATRGVTCRVLLDDVGSRKFLRSELSQRLRHGGVHVQAALPAQLWRVFFVRFDLRLHRKIVIIDGRIAYTGSLNLADPRLFKRDAGVGQWIDAMARIEGPGVEPLAVTFLSDWAVETGESIRELRATGDIHRDNRVGTAPFQVIPSGPTEKSGAIEQVLLTSIYTTQRELIFTTPYFVPDETFIKALISAAKRGVQVTLIVPRKVDSVLARWASQASQSDLVAAGVRVLLFEGGLLHTKSVTIDRQYSLFGSLNLDARSMRLNFEITLAIYDADFTEALLDLQDSYIRQSHARSKARGALAASADDFWKTPPGSWGHCSDLPWGKLRLD